ncbi:methyltransferase domain-containing protein [Candidatus Gottesmanbacteria bacterium]|nr:methyltransferase domain-containing protein [Candidatus Gottesmanbacteria bacterium]
MNTIPLEEIKKRHKYYNNAFFAKWAALYDYEKYLLTPLRRKAAKFLGLKPPKRILDVATGTGAQAYELSKQGHTVIGIDLSPEMLQQAKKKLSSKLTLSFQQADATDLPFKDNEFDVTSISLGLHDMPPEVDIIVLEEIKRVTKKNGKILIVDYNEPRKHWIAKIAFPLIRTYETKNWRPFIERGLETLLREVRLNPEIETNFFGLFQMVVVANKKINF